MQLNQSQTDELTQCSLAAGWLRPGQAIQRLEQAGEGNMNVVLRGYLNDGTSLVFKQALTYVAKYPHIAAPIERLDAELNFYASIADDQDLAARCPTIVGYDGDNHLLCMQDLGKVGDFTDLYQLDSAGVHTAQMQDLATLVTWLGQLHQHHVPPPQAQQLHNHGMRRLNHEHIFVVPYAAIPALELPQELVHYATSMRDDPALMRNLNELGKIYLGERSHASRTCLLHGDYYPGSWFRHADLGAMVLDPEFAFHGAPEFDVGVMMAHLLMTGIMTGIAPSQPMPLLQTYSTPEGFSMQLAKQFAGAEIARRLLGVAQLPLPVSTAQKLAWLQSAKSYLLHE